MNTADKQSAPGTSILRATGIAVAVGTFCAMVAVASPASVTYTLTGVGDGNLGPTSFSGATFTITVTADTGGVRALAPGVPCVDGASATFAIDEIASGSITTPVSVADNTSWHLLALSRGGCIESSPIWLVGFNPQFGSYDLVSNLGPIALTIPGAAPGITVNTSQGVLVFRSISVLTLHVQWPSNLARRAPSIEATGMADRATYAEEVV